VSYITGEPREVSQYELVHAEGMQTCNHFPSWPAVPELQCFDLHTQAFSKLISPDDRSDADYIYNNGKLASPKHTLTFKKEIHFFYKLIEHTHLQTIYITKCKIKIYVLQNA